MATTDRKLGPGAALLAAAATLVLAPATVWAESAVAVGGYLDSAPILNQAPALSATDTPSLTSTLGRLAVTDGGPGAAGLTYFTPRWSGFELGLGYAPDALSLREPDTPTGHVPGRDRAQADGSLAIGGGLRLSAVELGLSSHAQSGRGDAPGMVTAGVGYGFGPVNTNLTYGFAKPAADQELNLLALSADLALVPGIAITGGLAYTEEEKTGDQTAAGVLGLRLKF